MDRIEKPVINNGIALRERPNTPPSARLWALPIEFANCRVCSCGALCEEHSFLGGGTFGKVFDGIGKRRNSMAVALKRIKHFDRKGRDLREEIRREIAISSYIRKLKCANLVHLVDVWYDDDTTTCVFRKYGTDVFNLLSNIGRINEHHAKAIIYQVVSAVAALHMHNIAHLDIKPENIVYANGDTSPTGRVLLLDMGYSRSCDWPFKGTYPIFGTQAYLAPETISKCEYSPASDMWAIGVTAYFLMIRRYPYPDLKSASVNRPKPIPADVVISREGREFLAAVLTTVPGNRATAKELLCHKWFSSFTPVDYTEEYEEETLEDFSYGINEFPSNEYSLPKEEAEAEDDEEEEEVDKDVGGEAVFWGNVTYDEDDEVGDYSQYIENVPDPDTYVGTALHQSQSQSNTLSSPTTPSSSTLPTSPCASVYLEKLVLRQHVQSQTQAQSQSSEEGHKRVPLGDLPNMVEAGDDGNLRSDSLVLRNYSKNDDPERQKLKHTIRGGKECAIGVRGVGFGGKALKLVLPTNHLLYSKFSSLLSYFGLAQFATPKIWEILVCGKLDFSSMLIGQSSYSNSILKEFISINSLSPDVLTSNNATAVDPILDASGLYPGVTSVQDTTQKIHKLCYIFIQSIADLKKVIDLWSCDPAAAEAKYGSIEDWNILTLTQRSQTKEIFSELIAAMKKNCDSGATTTDNQYIVSFWNVLRQRLHLALKVVSNGKNRVRRRRRIQQGEDSSSVE